MPVANGGLPAIPAAANAAKHTGGVTLESCENQNTIMCAANTATPSSSSAGTATTAITTYAAVTGNPSPRINDAPATSTSAANNDPPDHPTINCASATPLPVRFSAPITSPDAINKVAVGAANRDPIANASTTARHPMRVTPPNCANTAIATIPAPAAYAGE